MNAVPLGFNVEEALERGLTTDSERRKYRRAIYTQILRVQAVTSSKIGNVFEVKNAALSAYARDISEGGFGLGLPETFKSGSILKVAFKVGDQDQEGSEAYVRVVWAQKGMHGVQFLMLEDSALRKIRVYIGGNRPLP
jgi:c-di-GMP-binding flagellar brake protein YcgR